MEDGLRPLLFAAMALGSMLLVGCDEVAPAAPAAEAGGGPKPDPTNAGDHTALDAGDHTALDAGDHTALDAGDRTPPDAGGVDSGAGDAGPWVDAAAGAGAEAGEEPDGLPARLSQTGLYADLGAEQFAQGVLPYAPQFELWSDGATKRRYLWLPPGQPIDASDVDAWQFPVGTKAWKEFTRDGVRIETRLIERAEDGWEMVAYLWREDGSDADAVELGAKDALGTPHDVPDSVTCLDCHEGRVGRLLGIGAVQLSHDNGGATVTTLRDGGRLSGPVPSLTVPGDAATRGVLGGLHANCGHCHNPEHSEAYSKSDGLTLWLTVDRLSTVAETSSYQTTVAVPLSDDLEGFMHRIVAGQPDDSGLLARMELLPGDSDAMPPLAVEEIDGPFVQAVRTWIGGL